MARKSCFLQAAQQAQTHAAEQARSHSVDAKQQSDKIQELSDKLAAAEAQHEEKDKELAERWTHLRGLIANHERDRVLLNEQLTAASIGKPNTLSAQQFCFGEMIPPMRQLNTCQQGFKCLDF